MDLNDSIHLDFEQRDSTIKRDCEKDEDEDKSKHETTIKKLENTKR